MKGNDLLAITDGRLGSNLVVVEDDPEQDKRRSNILKSREMNRKRSAKGPRAESRGKGSVFDRLSKDGSKKGDLSVVTSGLHSSGNNTLVRPSVEPMLAIEPQVVSDLMEP